MSSHTIVRDNQSPEVEQLKKQLASYKKENEKLAGERKDAEETTRGMTATRHTARTEVQRLYDELSKRKSENHRLRQEMEGSTNIVRSLEAKLQETESELASTRHALDVAKNQLKVVSEQKAQLHTLLDDRTFELKGAQSFLTTADASSNADVISMLQRLNAEVLQSAAYMAESMVDTFSFESDGVVRNENAYAVVTGLFGQSLAHYLGTKKHKDDPLLIQIAFQSCFVQFLEFVICSWTLPGDDVNRVFSRTYERIQYGGECK
jgi:predicted RNase H-like nuclease (RuvC/YqgF family)